MQINDGISHKKQKALTKASYMEMMNASRSYQLLAHALVFVTIHQGDDSGGCIAKVVLLDYIAG